MLVNPLKIQRLEKAGSIAGGWHANCPCTADYALESSLRGSQLGHGCLASLLRATNHVCAHLEDLSMSLLRRLALPASESQLAVALALAAVAMSLMLWAILWQSDIISYQREVIRWMWSWKFGG